MLGTNFRPLVDAFTILRRSRRLASFVSFSLAFAVCVTGCRTTPQVFHKEFDRSLIGTEPVKVRSTIAQDDIFVPFKATHSPPVKSSNFDLIGGIVDAIFEAPHQVANEEREKEAKRRMAPLLAQTLNVEFRANFWDALKQTLKESPTMKFGDVETSRQTRPVSVEELRTQPLLVLDTGYRLSSDCAVLMVQTKANYYEAGNNRPVYFGYYTYFAEVPDARPDAAITKWAGDGAALYKSAVAEAIKETMKMLRADLFQGTTPGAAQGETVAKFRSPDDFLLSKIGDYKGALVETDGDRVLFRENGGNLFALPKRAIIK